MKFLLYILLFFIVLVLPLQPVYAALLRSDEFTLETVKPAAFQAIINPRLGEKENGKPLRIAVSSDTISFGPLTATNPIKREISISVDVGTNSGYLLFVSENHPLQDGQNEIPDTTCDNGTCTEKIASEWINPFTFGLGFSFDDRRYWQFPDSSKKESAEAITQGRLFVKLNVNQEEVLRSKHYENTITFLAIPKL